ncbi:MAG TPA: hypothetical protein PLB05_10125 [Candidatus Omnitrophota bacterium]|jgi:adenylate kinase family enzyme|nr:hypothetical protein [Candidatus Omnitrophota bacterium]HPN57097.1 hypothetical protein [Candidatus Omnitrophota bacterium]
MFTINIAALEKVRKALACYKNIRWVIGGSCSGKTTLCRALSKRDNVFVYDMDEHIFGGYMGRYTPRKHPASKAWFSAENPLDWALSLSLDAFDNLNKAANVEYLRLFSEDMKKEKRGRLIVVDGGITHPSVLARVLPEQYIVCLRVSLAESQRLWETDKSKKVMKEMISRLPHPREKWQKFLKLNALTTRTILKESRDCGIKIVDRDAASAPGLMKIFLSAGRWPLQPRGRNRT